MLATIALFGALSLFAQDSSKEIQVWIQKLRSDRIEEREQATQELKKLGTAALPELEKVAADKDDEVAARARILLRTIRLKDMLGIELKDIDNLPRANEFCTLVLHPRHVSPRTVQAVLINLVSFPQNCLSVEDSGTLVLSDYASVLRKCAEIVKEVDVLRSFRVSIAILEGRSAKEASVPEPFGNLRLPETTGSNHFKLLGTGSAKLDRVVLVQQKPGLPGGSGKNVLRIAGPPSYLVEFGGSVKAEGGPTIEGLTVSLDQEPPRRVFEARITL